MNGDSEAIVILPLPQPATAKQLRKWRAKAATKASRTASDVVLVAVQAVDAAATSGAAVPIPAVRQAATMPAWQFDAAVAQLVLDRRVYVHRHDLPSSLPDATQRACYWDDGRCYCGMSLAAR